MSTQETRQHFKFARRARNWGISALVAATIGGYTLYQRSAVSADAVAPLQASAISFVAQTTPETATGLYKDGEYTGDSIQAGRWGSVQVTAIITNGQISDFKIDNYPHSRSMSQRISQIALPYLMQEAIRAQSTSVDMVTGATLTSEAFIQSLQSALADASNGATPAPTPNMSGSSL